MIVALIGFQKYKKYSFCANLVSFVRPPGLKNRFGSTQIIKNHHFVVHFLYFRMVFMMRYFPLFAISLLVGLPKLFCQDHMIPPGHKMMFLADRYEILSGRFMQGTQLTGGYVFRQDILDLQKHIEPERLSRSDVFNLDQYLNKDLQTGNAPMFGRTPKYKNIYASPAYFLDYYDSAMNYRVTLNPILELRGGEDRHDPNRFLYTNTRGIEATGYIGQRRRVGFYSMATENQAALPRYVDAFTDSIHILPNQGFWKTFKDDGYDFFQAQGYVWGNLNPYISLRLGHDKLHWGNGVRSLVISDFAPPQFFMQASTNLGIFNYQNYWAEFMDFDFLTGGDLNQKKYGVFHRLGVNLSKTVNIGVFEAVVFDRQDPDQNNRFDINYLNPIIFYRAVEQNLGSQDNALVGIDFKWNFFKIGQLYSMFILDEFKLDELRGRTGWWANKYALQTGVKFMNFLRVPNLDVWAENNWVRPFTYSHFRSGGNWAHYRQAIAHPLGANFNEMMVGVRYQPLPRLHIKSTFITGSKGYNPYYTSGPNFGGDILRNYAQRAQEYGNEIGQGSKVAFMIIDSRVSYMIKQNLFIDINSTYRHFNSEDNLFDFPLSHWHSIGLRWNIDSRDRLRYY